MRLTHNVLSLVALIVACGVLVGFLFYKDLYLAGLVVAAIFSGSIGAYLFH